MLNDIQKEFTFSSSGQLFKGSDGGCERGHVDMVLSMFGLDERVALFWGRYSVNCFCKFKGS